MKYEIIFEVDLSVLSATTKDLENELNKSMNDFGFNEKLVVRTQLPFVLTINKYITDPELAQLSAALLNTLNETKPELKATLLKSLTIN